LQIVLRDNSNAQDDGVGVAQLLLEHNAEVYARDKYHISSSDLACCFGKEKIGQVLLGDGPKLKLENNWDQTAFRLWIEGEYYFQEHSLRVSHIFPRVWRGWECTRQIRLNPLTFRIIHGRPEMARALLNHGVKSNAKNHRGETALHVVSRGRYDPESQDGVCIAQLLLERGVDVNAQDKDHDPVTSCILQWKARDGMRAP